MKKLKRMNAAVGAVSLAIVGGVAYWELGGLTSPGDLHPSHAQIKELRGSKGCVACHGDETRPMAVACFDCHEVIAAQIEARSGLHGAMDNGVAPLDCQVCHLEHSHGTVDLVSAKSFASAGVAVRNSYGHEHVHDFGLMGTHETLACVKCHNAADTNSLKEGTKRFLGLSQTCTDCHEDSHQGAYGADCASCHGQSDAFEVVGAFEHTEAFPLIDSHAGLSCKACHEAGSAYAIDVLKESGDANLVVRSCADCHETPHASSFIEQMAWQERMMPADVCEACHLVSHETFLYPEATLTPAQHVATGFLLEPPHDTQDCAECHEQIGQRGAIAAEVNLQVEFVAFFPGRTNDECRACHEDPHKGQFDVGAREAKCLSCHDPMHFTPSKFDVERHTETDFPLTGVHATVTCAECHTAVDEVVQYAQTPTSCAACHDDPHAGQFMASSSGDDCSACHTTTAFEPTHFTIAEHQQTKFPLTGIHQAVACRSCHVEKAGVREFVGTAQDCAACHEDVHDGAFDEPGRPLQVNGKHGCARCHTTDSFDAIEWTGSMHEQWTGYALIGAHAEAKCADCHGSARGVRGRGYKLPSTACAACHEDVHLGQFVEAGQVDCARCHTERATFEQPTFDHQRDSRFPLDEQHIGLECSQCHRPARASNGQVITRYRPLGHECQDCHGFHSSDRKVQ
ncbi:MAG: hypothetical protein KDA20_03760 [Phycisphaerales bacterium]|nr:hypothetical protein [Phycisphaerales bacterium]